MTLLAFMGSHMEGSTWGNLVQTQKMGDSLQRNQHSAFSYASCLNGYSLLTQMEPGIIAWLIGGLGNQLFILTASWLAAKHHGCPLYLLTNTGNKHNKEGHDYRETVFSHVGTPIQDLESTEQTLRLLMASGWTLAHQGKSSFAPYSFMDTPLPAIYMFYYQFYPPMEDHKEEIQAMYLKGLAGFRQQMLDAYPDAKNHAFLHVRRGDYLQYSNIHPLVPSSYYEEALARLGGPCLIVSDDPAWVKEQPWAQRNGLLVVEGRNELETFALMTLCERGAICANSSFSWWGAFLGAYRVGAPVFVPRTWILTEQVVCLFPEEWTVI